MHIRFQFESETSTQSTSTATTPVEVIVLSSATGLVVLVIIISGSFWCWKTGKCCEFKKNDSVIEQNEMYGTAVDYNQYEQDAYDTKVVDNNDYYYDNEY